VVKIPVVLPEGGFDHLSLFMDLRNGGSKTKEKLGVIWFVADYTIWKTRNAMVFNWEGFEWERVVEETNVHSWRILRARVKGFNYQLSEWMQNPTMCLGIVIRE
jgi:hypothetical protein